MGENISKGEKLIEINDPSGKWSELTLLPEWEEKFYDVYTVRKHGKWVMLKALKKEYAEDPKYIAMLEQEFETRYNLAHANIVMVNDFEKDVPGVGRAIITDDVYGYSLRRLIDEKRLTPKIVHRLQTQLLDAMIRWGRSLHRTRRRISRAMGGCLMKCSTISPHPCLACARLPNAAKMGISTPSQMCN